MIYGYIRVSTDKQTVENQDIEDYFTMDIDVHREMQKKTDKQILNTEDMPMINFIKGKFGKEAVEIIEENL